MDGDTQNQNAPQGDSGIGWKSELPEAMRNSEAFAPYKSKSELWEGHAKLYTEHNAAVQKATELESKIANYIPKLPDNASEEDRNQFYSALGRPEKPEQYEFAGDDKSAPEWTAYWKSEFHKLGLPKDTARGLSEVFDRKIQEVVDAHNAGIQQQIQESSEKLKVELGDKYDASIELAKRMWAKHGDDDFDKMFTGETSATRFSMIKHLLKIAKLTGEDTSLQGAPGAGINKDDASSWFPNSPKSPTGR